MIVNTAYIYMGVGGGGAEVNPVIFSKNEINYKYTGTNFYITPDGYIGIGGNSELIFEDLDLTTFEKLTITAYNDLNKTQYLTVNVIDSSGNVSNGITLSFNRNNTGTNLFDIPAEFKRAKMKIKFSLPAFSQLTLQSAILS